jgi:chromosome segregation ATPase
MRPFLLLLVLSTGARADGAGEARLREALRAATGQLHALEDEQAGWKAKEAQYKKELEELRAQLATAQAAPKREDGARLARLNEKLAQETQAQGKLAESLSRCEKSLLESGEEARKAEAERVKITGQIDGLTARTASCETKNTRLYGVGKSILDWLDKVGPGAALAARDPFLGLKRVELENVAQDYQDKLLEQRIRR